jgi:surface protein
MDGDKNIVGNFKLMDSDGDGVTDDLDSCTDTPSGERVDENGCILNPLYLDDNGVTYTIVSEEQLRNMISNNEDVSKVCTSKITNMNYMFSSSQFNGDISNWDVSSVTNMGGMFIGSDNFNQDLSNWNVLNVTQCNGFSTNTPQWTLPKPNFTNCNPN